MKIAKNQDKYWHQRGARCNHKKCRGKLWGQMEVVNRQEKLTYVYCMKKGCGYISKDKNEIQRWKKSFNKKLTKKMKTEIQETELYKKFKKALNIKHDMRPDDNTVVVDCCKIAEEYAKQKWEEACQLQINSCLNNMRTPLSDSLAYGDVSSAPKPQFKP